MLDFLISLYAPHVCVGCQTEGRILCEDCARALTPAAERCYRCRRLSAGGRTCETCRRSSQLYSVRAVTPYEGVGKQLIGRLKFGGARAAATAAGQLLDQHLPLVETVVVHLPTATSRIRQRGYDQAALIARHAAKTGRRSYLPALTRVGQHRQLGASRRERFSQIEGSFVVRRPGWVRGRHVVVIDDVMTTGASLEAAAAALKAAGAKRVSAVVFARA